MSWSTTLHIYCTSGKRLPPKVTRLMQAAQSERRSDPIIRRAGNHQRRRARSGARLRHYALRLAYVAADCYHETQARYSALVFTTNGGTATLRRAPPEVWMQAQPQPQPQVDAAARRPRRARNIIQMTIGGARILSCESNPLSRPNGSMT